MNHHHAPELLSTSGYYTIYYNIFSTIYCILNPPRAGSQIPSSLAQTLAFCAADLSSCPDVDSDIYIYRDIYLFIYIYTYVFIYLNRYIHLYTVYPPSSCYIAVYIYHMLLYCTTRL